MDNTSSSWKFWLENEARNKLAVFFAEKRSKSSLLQSCFTEADQFAWPKECVLWWRKRLFWQSGVKFVSQTAKWVIDILETVTAKWLVCFLPTCFGVEVRPTLSPQKQLRGWPFFQEWLGVNGFWERQFDQGHGYFTLSKTWGMSNVFKCFDRGKWFLMNTLNKAGMVTPNAARHHGLGESRTMCFCKIPTLSNAWNNGKAKQRCTYTHTQSQ